MHAWLCENPTGVDAVKWTALPTPEPKPGEVRVKIAAASLNFPDLLIVQNKYQMKPPLPFIPGSEYAGTVDALGAGVDQLKVGDRVAACGGTGGFATHVCIDAGLAMRLPADFALDDASAFILTYGTTHHGDPDRQGAWRTRYRRGVVGRQVRAVQTTRRRRNGELQRCEFA
jgi:NADPH:quinone reductase